MRLGQEARTRRLITLEVIPDRVNPRELSQLRGRVDAVTVPALRNGFHDPSYPSTFNVTPQKRSIASALLVRKAGIEAIPSLTCRDCGSEELPGISGLVENGLESFLVVYGDPSGTSRDRYEFAKTHHLIRDICSNGNGNHPSIGAITNQYALDVEKEVAWTMSRVDAGADFILTNSSFDEDKVLEHRDRLQSAGLQTPLLIQVSIPQSLRNLLFVTRKFGIPVPAELERNLKKEPESGIDIAASAFDLLRKEADGIHFSYLLRKLSPIPTYLRLLDTIRGTEPLEALHRQGVEIVQGL